MKIQRMFEIVYLLLRNRKMTANQLAAHFEVSKRTILRDIEALSIAGIPIYTVKGKGGGIALLDQYVLDRFILTTKEQKMILSALESLVVTQQCDFEAIHDKLTTLFRQSEPDWLEIDFSRWGNDGEDNQRFSCLQQAIMESQILRLDYVNSCGESKCYLIAPIKLIFKAKFWYLRAYCEDKRGERLYKLSRIIKIERVERFFSREELRANKIETKAYQTERLVSLTLLFSKEAAFRGYDEFARVDIQKNSDGSLLVETHLPEDDWLYSFLLSLGTTVKVISPEHIRQNLIRKAEEIKANYLG